MRSVSFPSRAGKRTLRALQSGTRRPALGLHWARARLRVAGARRGGDGPLGRLGGGVAGGGGRSWGILGRVEPA